MVAYNPKTYTMYFWVLDDMPHVLLLGRIGMREVGLTVARMINGKPKVFEPTPEIFHHVPQCHNKFYEELELHIQQSHHQSRDDEILVLQN